MPRFEREFADGHTTRGVDVGSGRIADVPACHLQQPVDIAPRLLFRLWCQIAPLSAGLSYGYLDWLVRLNQALMPRLA